MLPDLFNHMEWADAQVLRAAVVASPRAFLDVWRGEPDSPVIVRVWKGNPAAEW